MKELAKYCLDILSKYPQLTKEISFLYNVAKQGVDEGENEYDEIEYCKRDIQSLIEDY